MVRISIFSLIGLLVIMAACARPPKPSMESIYRGLNERLPRIDASVLSGRRVLIDPGHGGHFQGTLGQDGLEESLVNLGVSLYLWGLLNEAGAQAFLTRSAERDFLAVDDSTLVRDLAARVALIDSLSPDILVSIHHNAQPQRDPGKNAVETYYRFGDPASRDLAFAVHRHLMRNLGIEDGEVRPGNYYILRNIDIPAILGEGSYLTHPVVEENLRLSGKQRLEAEAYFLGILEYFSRGTPVLTRVEPTDSTFDDVPTLGFSVTDIGGLGIDPGGIALEVNGERAVPLIDPKNGRIAYRLPWDAANGSYDISIGVRNLLGNSSRIHRAHFVLDVPPEAASFESRPRFVPRGGGTLQLRVRVLDGRGLSVADGTTVDIVVSPGSAPARGLVDRGVVEFPVRVPAGSESCHIRVVAGGHSFETTIEAGEPAEGLRPVVIADSLDLAPVLNATLLYGDSLVASGSTSGLYYLPLQNGDKRPVRVRAPGYEPSDYAPLALHESVHDTLRLRPWFEGRLLGRRFMLDPEGGFESDSGRGPLGLSGSYINLLVARYLEEYLMAAGAAVSLSRRTEQTLSARDVVDATNRFGADRYLEIRHRSAAPDRGRQVATFHFPGSGSGRALAASVQRALAEALGVPVKEPSELVTFPLQQTACPAIVIEFPTLATIDEELRLAEPWYQRLQAYAIFVGILGHYGMEDGVWLEVDLSSESPSDNWLVRLDDTWNLLSSPQGRARFLMQRDSRNVTVELRRGDDHFIHRTEPIDMTGHATTITVPMSRPVRDL